MLSAVARGDQTAAHPGEELLVADRIGRLQLQVAGQAGVGAGLREQPLGLLEHPWSCRPTRSPRARAAPARGCGPPSSRLTASLVQPGRNFGSAEASPMTMRRIRLAVLAFAALAALVTEGRRRRRSRARGRRGAGAARRLASWRSSRRAAACALGAARGPARWDRPHGAGWSTACRSRETDYAFTWEFPTETTPAQSGDAGARRSSSSPCSACSATTASATPSTRDGVADLSRPHGGSFGRRYAGAWATSHQNGLDADVLDPRWDLCECPAESWSDVDYGATQELIDASWGRERNTSSSPPPCTAGACCAGRAAWSSRCASTTRTCTCGSGPSRGQRLLAVRVDVQADGLAPVVDREQVGDGLRDLQPLPRPRPVCSTWTRTLWESTSTSLSSTWKVSQASIHIRFQWRNPSRPRYVPPVPPRPPSAPPRRDGGSRRRSPCRRG